VEQFEARLTPEQRADLLAEISAYLIPQQETNGTHDAATSREEQAEEQADEHDEAVMEVEGAGDHAQDDEAAEAAAAEEEDEDNELLHEEETKAGGEEEEGMADDAGDGDDGQAGQDNN
jgi:hypothetical protein